MFSSTLLLLYIAGVDYSVPLQYILMPMKKSVVINIVVINDNIIEEDEYFDIVITTEEAKLDSRRFTQVRIINSGGKYLTLCAMLVSLHVKYTYIQRIFHASSDLCQMLLLDLTKQAIPFVRMKSS